MGSGTKISFKDQMLIHELTVLAQKVLTLALDISAVQLQRTHTFSDLAIEEVEDILETSPPVDLITSDIPSFDDRFQKTVETIELLKEVIRHNKILDDKITQKQLHGAYMLLLEMANSCYVSIRIISSRAYD